MLKHLGVASLKGLGNQFTSLPTPEGARFLLSSRGARLGRRWDTVSGNAKKKQIPRGLTFARDDNRGNGAGAGMTNAMGMAVGEARKADPPRTNVREG
jgi:hypothetical protein